MPVKLERKLKRTAKKRGYGKERAGAYVYGTMANIEKKAKRKKPMKRKGK